MWTLPPLMSTSIRRHSHYKCSQVFFHFVHPSSTIVYYQTKEPKSATEEFQPISRQVRPKDDVVLHTSHRQGQAKYHSNKYPYTQHTQSCFQAFPLSIVAKMFLTYLKVYLGKQERGGKGEWGKGGMGDLVLNQNRELAVSIQANIQSCCLLNMCMKCIFSPSPSVYLGRH